MTRRNDGLPTAGAGQSGRMTNFGYTMMCEQSRPDQL